jgi:hypothetical protein
LRFEALDERRLSAITVNTLIDEADFNITDGDISLRDAIPLAPAGEMIDFSVTGTISLFVGTFHNKRIQTTKTSMMRRLNMFRNTFFAALTILAAAASSQAAIMLEASSAPLDSGLVGWTLRGVSTAGEVINGVNNPTVVAAGTGAGLHQVWQPLLGATPTRGDQFALTFSDAWRAYDSFWLFDSTNSLSFGGAFTETNSETGGKPDLPDGPAGAARTGFGTMGFSGAEASKAFTIASGLQGTSVPLGYFVLKDDEAAMVSLGVLDNSGGNTRMEGFQLGVPEPATMTMLGLAIVGLVGFVRRGR